MGHPTQATQHSRPANANCANTRTYNERIYNTIFTLLGFKTLGGAGPLITNMGIDRCGRLIKATGNKRTGSFLG